ncbi:isochorismate synthase [Cerasicoccus arenae]|uniref:isochorismate synthase n=1 Tax=Cerasicoccus arenae TaxID=424488 RepID=A0A8J3DF76_9BACT|nr:isochorismate synthase [Cerasicoccus arenae]MBK1859334.1 isochorismate synthase [Cerasicoccus arenae]GHB93880.1 isochorismate synthase [Cerasicoccus arenae]
MELISPDRFPQRDPQALASFLLHCRERARQRKHPQLASISLRAKHLDPLAVLQSIYEPTELHFYLERSQSEEAIAGAEAILEATFSGAQRFANVRAFADHVLENTIAVGDLDAPFSGPHFFAGFTFCDEAEGDDAYFAPATVFVPRWQVARRQGEYVATANLIIEPESDIATLSRKVLAAHAKFGRFDYDDLQSTGAPPPSVVEREDVGGDGWFAAAVDHALQNIDIDVYHKIVLARAVELKADQPFRPLETLARLRDRFPSCYSFSFANGDGQSFIGATPERLLRVESGRLFTEALAGSAPRGENAREDARHGAALLSSDKDLREHQLVVDSIISRLGEVDLVVKPPAAPRLLKLPNVQHLWSPISTELTQDQDILAVAARLHPTPAVGGQPRKAARDDIARIENFDRGLYAGAIGWFDYHGDGEMAVAIRSALIDGQRARLYAGAGIVAGSQPDRETAETDLKLRPLLDSLQ